MAASSSANTSSIVDPNIQLLHDTLDEIIRFVMANGPHVKQVGQDVLGTIFVPKAVLKQLALAIALQTGAMTLDQIIWVFNFVFSRFSSRSRLIRQLQREQTNAKTQDEWMDLAERIDNIQGNDVWRSDPNCPLYERERISARIDEFVHLMRRRDIFELMFVLRGGIGRNKFGLLHEGLFSKAMAGSKVLVETYHNVVCAALDFVCDASVQPGDAPIPSDARLAFFNETRHSYGRTALLLSGGAALGFYHVGVVRTLMNNRLMPRVLGGSSAGSLVCAMICTRTDEECQRDLFEIRGTTAPGHSGELAYHFFRPLILQDDDDDYNNQRQKPSAKVIPGEIGKVYNNTAGFLHDMKRTWQLFFPIGIRRASSIIFDMLTGNRRPSELLMNDTEHFRECCRKNIGDFTFQEAFDRTGRILNITVTPKNSSDPPRLLNYLTAPHVLVWSAAVASSSLPGVFEANRLMVKDADGTERYESAEGAKFADGSMEQDLPMQQLSEMFNVNHFIISQANPHAVMFATYNQKRSVWTNPVSGMINGVLSFLKDQVRCWFRHVVELVGARRIAPAFDTKRGVAATFFTQEYEGRDCDISLIPWMSHRGLVSAFMHCLYNPGEDEFRSWIEAAERETWKHIPAIKSHIAEEVTLDRCVQRLRKRVIVESWQKRRRVDSTGQKMGDRVPSFFNSPSLVNLSGLGVADQSTILNNDGTKIIAAAAASNGGDNTMPRREVLGDPEMATATAPNNWAAPDYTTMGWGGMGLSGNRSANSLERSGSNASGLFIDDSNEPIVPLGAPAFGNMGHHVSDSVVDGNLSSSDRQHPGENSVSSIGPRSSSEGTIQVQGQQQVSYIKTTSMARFYYRNTTINNLQRSHSAGVVDNGGDNTTSSDNSTSFIENNNNYGSTSTMNSQAQRKTKSHADLRYSLSTHSDEE